MEVIVLHHQRTRRRLEQNRRAALKKALQEEFNSKQVDVYALQAHELAGIWINIQKKKSGLSDAESEEMLEELTGFTLSTLRDQGSNAASAIVLGKLAADMHRSGNIFTRYRIVRNEGRKYIIFQGKPGLRKHLTAARYSLKNPKVMSMGVGKAAMKNLAKGSILFTLVASPVTRGLEWLFADKQAELESVLAGISTDIMKAIISTGLAYFTGSLIATLAGGAVIAIAPITVTIVTAVAIGYSLNLLDNTFGITESLGDAIAEHNLQWEQDIKQIKRDSAYFLETVPGQMEFMQRFFRR